jgi:hypothetical protein
MKADLDLVKIVLQRNKLDTRAIAQVIADITQQLAADAEQKDPAIKKQFVIVVSDPRGYLADRGDFTGWVVQIPEEESPTTTESRLISAAREFNTSPKGRRLPIKTMAEVCEHVPARYLKERGAFVRTKETVRVIAVKGGLGG